MIGFGTAMPWRWYKQAANSTMVGGDKSGVWSFLHVVYVPWVTFESFYIFYVELNVKLHKTLVLTICSHEQRSRYLE